MTLRETIRTNPLGLNIVIAWGAFWTVWSAATSFKGGLPGLSIGSAFVQGLFTWGFLRRAEWARVLTSIYAALLLFLVLPVTLFTLHAGGRSWPISYYPLAGVAACAWYLYYFWQPGIRQLFNGGVPPTALTTTGVMKLAAGLGIAFVILGVGVGIFAVKAVRPIIEKGREGSVRGELGMARSAIAIYFADNEGVYPPSPADLGSRYWPAGSKPTLWRDGSGIFKHPMTDEWLVVKSKVLTDSGKWAYIYNPDAKDHGTVYIDCTHLDSKSRPWHEY